jgi:hypothetical protein
MPSADEQAWLDACPWGESRSLTVNRGTGPSRTFTVDRRLVADPNTFRVQPVEPLAPFWQIPPIVCTPQPDPVTVLPWHWQPQTTGEPVIARFLGEGTAAG